MPRRFRFRGLVSTVIMAMVVVAIAACRHGPPPDEGDEPSHDPVAVHVRNQNFLDMNVFVVAGGGMSRRLGTVTGNSEADFSIPWSLAYSQSIAITAVPIGGFGSANTGSLTVSPGQVVEFTIGSVLRQSVATVHDPN